jgi:ribosomal protein L16 Arg81 hydroxylase
MNIENQNQPATRETMAEYLDRLAADQIAAGMDATGADIKAAAAEIRKLTQKVDKMAAAMAHVASREDQLASALFGLLEDRIRSEAESAAQDALEDYDPTEHYNFSDAVAEHSGESDEDRTRDIVREVIDSGSFTFHG